MCGILACLFSTDDSPAMRARVLALSRRQRHRGPDCSSSSSSSSSSGSGSGSSSQSGLHQWQNSFLAHERLAIIDPASGDQPLFNEDKTIVVAVNGEIYNHVELKKGIKARHPGKKFRTESDCERMMSDVPFGVLLSGGLDSSLVASIAARKIARDGDSKWGKLHSFCIGLEGSPDLAAARGVASFLGTDHHEFTFTVQEGIDAIGDVIAHIETYDVTTIRASTPMFLMSRKIKALGVKMVLSGEGSDEVFGGYLYFHKAPNREEFFQETVRKVQALYQFDCLRANKSTMAWGVEARVPFLDRAFLDTAMAIDPAEKMIDRSKGRIEKWILRKAFDTPERPYLPEAVLWRQKEQFSDGVGYSWIDGLKAHAEELVSDQQLAAAQHRYPDNTPRTKEAYLYRTVFEGHFPQKAAADTVPGGPSVACSTATAALWDAAWAGQEDPSGRAVAGVHDSAYAGAKA
ncbi:asparagine synthase [Raphidocelis subcapitata]|uniref:Asparagine synthetase [glutamine-hydrolyzing] n=1 Tax=Raphidocelis subcapitata TaxID=307507 RepID=A0A2V0PEM5_9CHLO|nr:asparagine synthase [Raphidocelis subcapitata]|eukprot:GBF97422.1 asparagine synthase [Raphidocelis subcapitata]